MVILLLVELKVNVEPLSSLFFSSLLNAHILPPCISIILLEINNPKPVPPAIEDVVANFVKSFGNISESIPVPVSFMLTITLLHYLLLLLIFFVPTITVMLPSSVNLIALFKRLEMT